MLGNRLSEFSERLSTGELPPPSRMLEVMMTGLRGDLTDTGVLVQLWGEAVTDPEVSRMIGPIFERVRGLMGPYLARWAVERQGMSADAAAAWADEVLPVFFGLAQGYIVQSALLPGFDGDDYLRGVGILLDGGDA